MATRVTVFLKQPGVFEAAAAAPAGRIPPIACTLLNPCVPIFGLANAGVPVLSLPAEVLVAPITLGIALGLLLGKAIGVFGFTMIAVRLRLAEMPPHAGWLQMLGVAVLCGIGFTMSIFITLLAFGGDPLLQAQAKVGVLGGSILSGLLGYALLRITSDHTKGPNVIVCF